MRNSFIKAVHRLLLKWIRKCTKSQIEVEYNERMRIVREFLHSLSPPLVIIENPTINYFTLPDGSFPTYSFVVPKLHAYIIVADVRNSSWESAEQFGVGRREWETYNRNLFIIERETASLTTGVEDLMPSFLLVKWDTPVSIDSLYSRVGLNLTILNRRIGASGGSYTQTTIESIPKDDENASSPPVMV